MVLLTVFSTVSLTKNCTISHMGGKNHFESYVLKWIRFLQGLLEFPLETNHALMTGKTMDEILRIRSQMLPTLKAILVFCLSADFSEKHTYALL